VAHRLWFTPPNPPRPAATRRLLTRATALRLEVAGRQVAAWRFGAGPTVALVHGWGGHAGQLGDFIEPLVAAGFQVAAFDAPGHGESGGSPMGFRQSSFLDFAAVVQALVARLGPLAGLVGHSGGAGAAGVLLRRGVRPARVVLVAPLVHPWSYVPGFARALGLDDRVVALFRGEVERRLAVRWEELDLTSAAVRAVAPPTLVVHDAEDREVPHAEGASLVGAWPARLLTTSGLGHYRVLRDPSVISEAVRFLAGQGISLT
jgi:pimeloyl-ACP methyl ester carboxylesterase